MGKQICMVPKHPACVGALPLLLSAQLIHPFHCGAGPTPTIGGHKNKQGTTSAAPAGKLRCAARETIDSHKWFIGLLRPKRSGKDRSAV